MEVTFGSHFKLSKPVNRNEILEKFPQLEGKNWPYVLNGAQANDSHQFDEFTSIRDENDGPVEEFLKKKGIPFEKVSSLEHFKKIFRDFHESWAQKYIDLYADSIEEKPKTSVPS